MNKKKLIITVIAAIVLLAIFLWIYWGQSISLRTFFPDDQWYYDISLLGVFFEGHVNFAVDEDSAGRIFTHLNTAKLKRGLPFDNWRGDALTIHTFYNDNMHAWLQILIIDDGRVRVTDFGTEKDYYFWGGEDLYSSILAIAEELPVKEQS